MPKVLEVGPHRFFFYSREGHEPPHVHVETAERFAKFWLDPVELVYAHRYNKREERQLKRIIEGHQVYLLERWNAYFQV